MSHENTFYRNDGTLHNGDCECIVVVTVAAVAPVLVIKTCLTLHNRVAEVWVLLLEIRK